MLNQFSRTQLLLGEEAMDKLKNSRVAVFGVGGVGGYVCEANRKASLKERYEVMCKYYGKVSTILLHGWFAVRFYFAKWFKGRV